MLSPRLVPLEAIAAHTLPRDRAGLDPEPFEELKASLRSSGLRARVELFPLDPAPAVESAAEGAAEEGSTGAAGEALRRATA